MDNFPDLLTSISLRKGVLKVKSLICILCSVAILLIQLPSQGFALVHQHESEEGLPVVRSIESLRDLDYESWQVVAYRKGEPGQPIVLRIVGYPGKLRLEHPAKLKVISGRREWNLQDITLLNVLLANDGRDAAAEFSLDPLLDDLSNNRPLRLFLPGGFIELPVPPYVVGEWRSLQELNFS